MKQLYEIHNAEVVRLLKFTFRMGVVLEPGDQVLDFGCGDGTFVYALRALDYDAFGFGLFTAVPRF
jgi:cyclopropane fatty-acyl-phospholipid synthase-like methyltransferase